MTDTHDALPPPLRAWLAGQALSGRRVVHVQPLAGGHRNHTVLLLVDRGERYVLRRYPHANTCAVEAALADRLAGRVPVPDVVAADPDGTAAGEPVLLSRFVTGDLVSVLVGSSRPGLPAHGTCELGRAVGAALAAIGTVTFSRPGLFDGPDLLPRPAGVAADLPGFVDHCLRTGNAHHALTAAEQDALRRHAARTAGPLTAVTGARRLVHADFNPKNLLAARREGDWVVTAVLDWEFAFAGSPLVDIGNMLRFGDELPRPYVDGFVAGFAAAGGHLPENWRAVAAALDLFALADFLTRPPDNPFFGKAVALLRRRVTATG